MNKQETAEAILVMQAWIDGEEIQCNEHLGWETAIAPSWGWDGQARKFRIKPSPREWWLNLEPDAVPRGYRELSETPVDDFVHVREILDEEM